MINSCFSLINFAKSLFKRLNNFSWVLGLDIQGIVRFSTCFMFIFPPSPREPTIREVNLLAWLRRAKKRVAE